MADGAVYDRLMGVQVPRLIPCPIGAGWVYDRLTGFIRMRKMMDDRRMKTIDTPLMVMEEEEESDCFKDCKPGMCPFLQSNGQMEDGDENR
jgi:hypothetical protein